VTTLLGRTTAGTSADFNGFPSTAAWKFTALASGTLAVIKAQTKVSNPTSTAVTLSCWDDTGGGTRPGARLTLQAADVLATARGTGVFAATLATTVAIVSGTVYWLAWASSTEQWNFQGDASGTYVENPANPVATPWPSAGNSGGTVNAILWGEDSGAGGGGVSQLLGLMGVGS
jgi:hypothetical protein